jgi:hypothetical protein
MFGTKLFPHQEKALTEALGCMEAMQESGVPVDSDAMRTIKAMLGIRGKIDESMSAACGSMMEAERAKRRVA